MNDDKKRLSEPPSAGVVGTGAIIGVLFGILAVFGLRKLKEEADKKNITADDIIIMVVRFIFFFFFMVIVMYIGYEIIDAFRGAPSWFNDK